MPTVPRVTNPTVQTQTTQRAVARDLPTNAFGGGFGKAIGTVALQFEAAQKQVDITVSENALNQFEREKNDLLFNPQSGYFNSQGLDAMEQSAGTIKKFDELKQRYMENMKSQDARTMFSTAADARIGRDARSVQQHAAKGQRAQDIANQTAASENAVENAALYYANDEELAISAGTGAEAVVEKAKMEGISGAPLNERLQTFRSIHARTAIEAAVTSGDLERATELQAKATSGKLLEGPDAVAITKLMTAETDKQEVRGHVDRIYNSDDTRQEKLAKARAIKDPDQSKEVERQIGNRISADQKALAEQKREAYDTSWKQIDAGALLYANIPHADRELMTPAQLKNLQAVEKSKATGTTVKNNPILLDELLQLSPEQLVNVDLADYATRLSSGDLSKLSSAQTDARGGNSSVVRSDSSIVASGLAQVLGHKPNDKNKRDRAVSDVFNELVEDEIAAMTATLPANQKKLTSVQLRDLVKRMSRDVALTGSGIIVPFTEQRLTQDDVGKLNEIVPEEDLGELPGVADWLRARGKVVNVDTLQATYLHLKKTGKLGK